MRLLIVCFLSAFAATLSAQQEYAHISAAGHDVRRTVVANGIYQFSVLRDGWVRQLNTVVVVNENDVLVFDTSTRPSSARIILDEIRKITPKPIRYVVNSHHHPDHWSGNAVYADAFPAAQIIASSRSRELMVASAPLWIPRFRDNLASVEEVLKKLDPSASEVDRRQAADDVESFRSLLEEQSTLRRVFPTLTYEKSMTLYDGGREFRFYEVTGDAEGTTVLYLPNEKMLITGDAVSLPMPYTNYFPSRQAASLRMLLGLDYDTVIPGHGPALKDKQFMRDELEFIETVRARTRQALSTGLQTLAEVQHAVNMDDLRERFAHGDPDVETRFNDRVRFLVKMSLRELGQDYN